MKNIYKLFCGLVALTTAACSSEEPTQMEQLPTSPDGQEVSVTAYTPNSQANSRIEFTPTEGSNAMTLSWSVEESFSVIRGGENKTFSKTTEGNTFLGSLPGDSTSGDSYAIYPVVTDTDQAAVVMDLSSQTGNWDSSKTYMRATFDVPTATFQFSHLTAALKATFTGLPEGTTIKKIMVTTEQSCVNPFVNLADGVLTAPEERKALKDVVISYDKPITTDQEVYIYLPPMTAAEKALTFEVITDEGISYGGWLRTGTKDIEAGKVYAATGVTMKMIDYFTMSAGDKQVVRIHAEGMFSLPQTLQYSVNNAPWERVYSGSAITFGGSKGNLRLRNINENGLAQDATKYSRFEFEERAGVTISGDLRTLINWESYDTVDTKNARFCNLFWNCTALSNISAKLLPADATLAEECYAGMFYGCRGLMALPADLLPATTLAPKCYKEMFFLCWGLRDLPANLLPATTLAPNCYQDMFQYCSYLKEVPANFLPATTLAEECYKGMFSECGSLTAAPALPATTLAKGCYESMFSYCGSLTTAPVLPAATLVEKCYKSMFSCSNSLNNITMMATDIQAENCLKEWVYDVATRGTFYKILSLGMPTGADGIPAGWTIEAVAPGDDVPDMETGGEW